VDKLESFSWRGRQLSHKRKKDYGRHGKEAKWGLELDQMTLHNVIVPNATFMSVIHP
jgi:hypothetical protein